MKINDAYNLVIPVSDGIQVFSAPVSEEVFDANWRVLSEAQAQIFGDGMKKALLTGPRIAALAISDAGKRIAAENGEDGDAAASAFRAEIKRLSTVLVPTANGYEMQPVDGGALDNADWKEIEGLLCFFTCALFLQSRRDRRAMAESMAEMLNCTLTSQNCGDYCDSLKTSTPAAKLNKAAASSVPV